MQPIKKLWAGTALAALGMGVAQANVVYNFDPDPGSGGPYVQASGGQIVVTDNAYRSGSLHVRYDATNGSIDYLSNGAVDTSQLPTGIQDPRESQLLSASLTALSKPAANGDSGYPVGPALVTRRDGVSTPVAANLTFNPSGTLSGQLFILSEENRGTATGSGSNWRMFGIGSDYFVSGPCTNNMYCDAGTGAWHVDPTTLPGENTSNVPTPPVWPLFGLAALGLFGFAKRRADKVSSSSSWA